MPPQEGLSTFDGPTAQATQVGVIQTVAARRLAATLLCHSDLTRVGDGSAELRRRGARMGPTPWPVLLRGETGTGKQLVACGLHLASRRAGPFLAVDLAVLPADLAALRVQVRSG